MAPRRILQFGRHGQLAHEICLQAPQWGWRVTALDRSEADLSQPGAAARAVETNHADLVVIAAAYTAVDQAEAEEPLARRINADAPAEIAATAAAHGLPVMLVSTDYVFSGFAAWAWREEDAPAPVSAYGRTKLAGERAVLAVNPRAVVLRTSWLFSAWGQNFVKTMLALAARQDTIDVVDDQVGRPTAASDLAETILRMGPGLTEEGPYGLYHFANAGQTSWAGLAQAVMQGARLRGWPYADIRRVTTPDMLRPAPRPAWSVLDTQKIERDFGVAPRPWREALNAALDAIKAGESFPPG